MTPQPTRPAAALLAGLVLALAAAGCGKPVPPKPDADKPADAKPAPQPVTGPGAVTPGGATTPPPPAGAQAVDPKGPVQAEAEKFVKDLREGTATADRLTPAFAKAVGKPLLSGPDKEAGFSAGAAEAWLKRAGAALGGVGLPAGYATPTAAVFTGSFHGPAVPDGRFLLRLAQAGGGWKVDWFQLGAAKVPTPAGNPATPDEPFQDFAATAFLDALTGGPAAAKDDRVLSFAAALTPARRAGWAEPFSQDKARGYDFHPAKLGQIAEVFSDPAGPYTRTRTGADAYKVELTKGGAVKAYTLKLVKGAAPGEWLVDDLTAQ